jgi:hypothetical protein
MILNGSVSGRGSGGLGVSWGEYGGVSRLRRLTIDAGELRMTGTNDGSGIGNGWGYYGTSMIGNLTIVSGNITASSSYYGSGIGTGAGGYSNGGISTIGNLLILSGNITASSSHYGSGIGTGHDYYTGTSMIGNLTIVSGNITASGSSYGSGIGTSIGQSGGISMIETLSILGGRIRVNGTQSGIGSGFEESEVKLLRLSRTVNLFCTVMSTTKFPINASSIVLSDASLTITTPQNRIFGVNPFRQGSLNLYFVYGKVTSADSEPLLLLNSTFLQIGNVSLPNCDFWRFCLSGLDHESCIDIDINIDMGIESKSVKSLLFSVPSEGNYSIRVLNEGLIGFIETEAGVSSFNVWSDFCFISEVHFIPDSSPTPSAIQIQTETFTIPLSAGYRPGRMTILRFGWFLFWLGLTR